MKFQYILVFFGVLTDHVSVQAKTEMLCPTRSLRKRTTMIFGKNCCSDKAHAEQYRFIKKQ